MEFVIISRIISHVTCYNLSALIGGKSILKIPLKDLLFSLNAVILTNESDEFITGHVIYNPAYTGKSLSEALLFAEHGENMLCTEIVFDIQNNFSMFSPCSAKRRAYDKDLPVLSPA